jgi:hypothetical protein
MLAVSLRLAGTSRSARGRTVYPMPFHGAGRMLGGEVFGKVIVAPDG